MAFQTSVSLANCEYTYSLHPNVKKFTLRDNTFAESKVGNYELVCWNLYPTAEMVFC